MPKSEHEARAARYANTPVQVPGALTMDRLQSEATNFVLANGRSEASNLYVPGKRKGTTPEQAFAAGLEANPEAYEQYRAKHNSAALLAQLKAAGVAVDFQ